MKVPYTNFKTREGDADEVGGCTFIGGEWKDKDTAEIFEKKKVVVFETKCRIKVKKYIAQKT